jgi:hypothetical protein
VRPPEIKPAEPVFRSLYGEAGCLAVGSCTRNHFLDCLNWRETYRIGELGGSNRGIGQALSQRFRDTSECREQSQEHR